MSSKTDQPTRFRVLTDHRALRWLESPPNTIRMAEFIEGQIKKTTPTTVEAVEALVTEIVDKGRWYLVTLLVSVFGDFKDETVAKNLIAKFHSKPWGQPNAHTLPYEHQDNHIQFEAWAIVQVSALPPDTTAAP